MLPIKEVLLKTVVAIAGPTGAGKSELALRIAEQFRGEVVNCDSLQIYRYFDIGTAKLAPEDMRGVPHHLIDILDPDRVFTAGEYARLGRAALTAISGRGGLPVVAGGTGFLPSGALRGLVPRAGARRGYARAAGCARTAAARIAAPPAGAIRSRPRRRASTHTTCPR